MKFFWILYAKWNNWQINLNVFLHSYYQHQIAIFYFCIGNTIGILTDNVLAATYNLSCLWIPVSHAVVEWFFSQVTSVFKMWKSCDFECVQDRYQCCVIFACFKLRSWCFLTAQWWLWYTDSLGLARVFDYDIYWRTRACFVYLCHHSRSHFT